MKSPDTIVADIHAIRMKIYEKQKNMTRDEINAYYDDVEERLSMQYGIKFVSVDEVRGYSREAAGAK